MVDKDVKLARPLRPDVYMYAAEHLSRLDVYTNSATKAKANGPSDYSEETA